MAEVLYVVDVFSLLFQVFHAIPPMTGPSGQPTNATFGFTRDLLSILRDHKPTHLICAMDSKGDGVRNDIYPEYKANRDEMPEDLKPQVEMIVQIMEGFRIPIMKMDGWEADDVIATVTRQAVEQKVDVRIMTGDKDLRQLLGPRVKIFNSRKNALYDEKNLRDDWGIRPDQVIDFQSLVGDSVDNVPGVPLVGPKKATILLNDFGGLEDVLARADEANGPKLRENLKKFADQARMSRKLVTLYQDLPIEVDWEACRVADLDQETLLRLFDEFGFRRFGDEVRALGGGDSAPGTQSLLFDDNECLWKNINSSDKFESFLAELKQQTKFCVDLETTGLDAVQADIVGWAFSWQTGTGYYLPVRGPRGSALLDAQTVADVLRPILEDPETEISNQNIKYDMLVMQRAGIRLRGVGVDPMVGSYLLNAAARSHGLDALAQRYLNRKMIPISSLIGTGKSQKRMDEINVDQVAEYASEDADIALQVASIISDALHEQDLWELYWQLERPLISVLADMEFKGIRVDVDELNRQSDELGQRLETLVTEIYEMAGREFNIESPKQLQTVLFDELQLPVQKKTKTGASTDQSVLEKLAVLHPLPKLVTEHRHLSKLKGTYLDTLPAQVNPETGRIHTSFNQVVAATGRLSSNNPNLQNIPIRTHEGRRVRRAFIPSQPDWKLVCMDYSQIELRMLAHYSDAALIEAFETGADIHTAVAAEVFTVQPDKVDSDMRRVAKAVNFGVIYGQSAFGLSAALGISKGEAAEFIDGYFQRYSGVRAFLEEILDECTKTGYARTILGRRRAISGIRRNRRGQLNMPERTAINTVIQGSAADLIKRAMINVHNRIADENHSARMLLQIHDELVFEVPDADVASLIALARHEMESAMDLRVPITVDIAVGGNWLAVESL